MTEAEYHALDVVSVGEALVDFVAPDADSLENATHFVRAAGGAPANVVVAAARLGARCALIGAVGNDPFGAYIQTILANNGVDVSALKCLPQRTSLAFVARNTGGIPDFVFYRGADAALSAEDIPRAMIGRARYLHVSSMAIMAEPSRSATLQAIEMAATTSTLISVDPNLRPSSWTSVAAARRALRPLLDAAHVLKLNDEEARLFSGRHNLQEAMQSLSKDGRLLVITLGPEGCIWTWQGQTGNVTAPQVEVADTTGAGDAFVGALLAELCIRDVDGHTFSSLQPDTLREVLRIACAAAALACTETGAMASLPTRNEVDRLLSSER